MVTWATWLMLASASPRNPYVAIEFKSSNFCSLLVVKRSQTISMSSFWKKTKTTFIIEIFYSIGCLLDETRVLWWLQSTPVISRLLGAKICERELSGSPVISREGHDSRLEGHRPTYMTYSGVYKSQTVCWAIIEVLTFPRSLHTSTSHQRQITTSNTRF